MSSPRRTHVAASVAYAVLAAMMAGVLLSSARLLPEFELPSLHLSSGSDPQASAPRTPAPTRGRATPPSPAATTHPNLLRPTTTTPPLAAPSTRACDATDFDCLVAGASSPEHTQPGLAGPPTVVVKFRPSQPAGPGAGRTRRPQDQAAGSTVGTSAGGTPTPTAAASAAAPTASADAPAGTPSATPTPTASATPTDGPVVETTATPDPAGTVGGGSGPTGSAPASSPPPGP